MRRAALILSTLPALLLACDGASPCLEDPPDSYLSVNIHDSTPDGPYTLAPETIETLRFTVDGGAEATGVDAVFSWLDGPAGLSASQVDCDAPLNTLVDLDDGMATQQLEASCAGADCAIEVCIRFDSAQGGQGDFVVQVAPYRPTECGDETVFLQEAPLSDMNPATL